MGTHARSPRSYTWPILVVGIALFAFYWFEMRPMMVYRACAEQSSADARALLANKADLAAGTTQGATYRQLLDKNLYLRSDYESFLMKCLTYEGYQIVAYDGELPEEAVDPEQE